MKFLYLKSKKVVLIIALAFSASYSPMYAATKVVCQEAYTKSIESICNYFDAIMDDFKSTFKDSFADNSTEKLNITAKKIEQKHTEIKEFVHQLKEKSDQLTESGDRNSDLHQFIDILLDLAHELEKHFKQTYSTLTNCLNKKLKAAAFAKKLSDVIETIITDHNFSEIDKHLLELRAVSPVEVTPIIDEIRADIKKVLQEYKLNKNKQNAAAISILRKRLPY